MENLVLENVSKSYDSFKAVDQISFTVEKGTVFGLLGPNGAGKTTTMRMIMNIIIPDSGAIKLLGQPFQESLKERIGYLPEERGLYPKMKVSDHLQFLGELKGMHSGVARRQALAWLERFALTQWANHKVRDLSKGMQQKVQFIGTVLNSPPLLIVDEPFSGLDPINTKFLKDILLEMKAAGTAIILSTHLMDQAEKLCDRILMINRGREVLQGNLEEIRKKYYQNKIILEYRGNSEFIKDLTFVAKLNDFGNYMEIQLFPGIETQQLFRTIASSDLTIIRFEVARLSLNDIFIELMGA